MIVLTHDQVVEVRANAVKAQQESPCLTGAFIVAFCDSHEVMRSEIKRLQNALKDREDRLMNVCGLCREAVDVSDFDNPPSLMPREVD